MSELEKGKMVASAEAASAVANVARSDPAPLPPGDEEPAAGHLPECVRDRVPEGLHVVFHAPLLSTEDRNGHYRFMEHLIHAFRPARNDVIGWIRIRDVADEDVDVRRLRKLKADVIEMALTDRPTSSTGQQPPWLIPPDEPFNPHKKPGDPPRSRYTRETDPLADMLKDRYDEIEEYWKDKWPTPAAQAPAKPFDAARGFSATIELQERIDKLLDKAEERRRRALLDLHSHFQGRDRDALGSQDVVDLGCDDTSNPEAA
jgi:hypothetical protein